MKTLILELRDRGTFIPVIAIEIKPSSEELYLVRRAGFANDTDAMILFGRLTGGRFEYDHYHWGDRTFHVAHDYIEKNFNDLKDGDVVDVQFILGETTDKKISERFGEN